jgi:hypothetical protein
MVSGISSVDLAAWYPRLFHMAEAGAWPGIHRHGLLSTSVLLDLFEVGGPLRESLERRQRPECVTVSHPRHGSAVIRDQKPMDDRGLLRSLRDGLTPADWYALLNGRVFFWVSEHRLEKLLGARAYRGRLQTVLTLDTAALLARHAPRVTLSPINSGATKPVPQPRGRDTFLPLGDYPFEAWRKKRGKTDIVVELAVAHSVPDVVDCVLRVEERQFGKKHSVLWERPTR